MHCRGRPPHRVAAADLGVLLRDRLRQERPHRRHPGSLPRAALACRCQSPCRLEALNTRSRPASASGRSRRCGRPPRSRIASFQPNRVIHESSVAGAHGADALTPGGRVSSRPPRCPPLPSDIMRCLRQNVLRGPPNFAHHAPRCATRGYLDDLNSPHGEACPSSAGRDARSAIISAPPRVA